MTFPRKLGVLLLLTALVAAVAYEYGIALPSLRWFYSFDAKPGTYEVGSWHAQQGRWIGHGFAVVMALVGLALLVWGGGFQWNPLTLRKFTRFRSIGRGWFSFRLLVLLMLLAGMDQLLVGKRALAVCYEGKWSFPAFERKIYVEKDFGGESKEEANYRDLQARFRQEDRGNRVILAPIPWDPTFDSDDVLQLQLVEQDGKLYRPGEDAPYNGQATKFRVGSQDARERVARIRGGLRDGDESFFDEKGDFIGRLTWTAGKRGDAPGSEIPESIWESPQPWMELLYPPTPPSWQERHFLGTDSKGWDIAAQLFGGLQVIFKASALYLCLTYFIGITLGLLMGYFAGIFDLVMQRLIEILSNVPFLLVVMILISNQGREDASLSKILLIYCIFSWISVSTYLRTSTFKEKARDYVAAASVLGAGTFRILFVHILPNAISTIVTLLPFSVAGLTTSLTALDFLGFGLPDTYPSWGRVLEDGTSNLTSPWIVSSVFAIMIGMLLVITFIGEAIREAFDPKKFTTYR